ncbi:hypothetical protein F5X97DRAFT_116872 [Nemania serpens]|nr:hypothetical protein F5X97DRAFT_116872 [Nemania serpens]
MGFRSLLRTKKISVNDSNRVYTFSSDNFTVCTMSTTSHSSNGSRPTSRHYDTGFPDIFASCTTSMRHPDAIVDPGFAISSEHIDPANTMHRSRKSLLHKHRRTISSGKINEASFGDHNYTERPSSSTSTANSANDLIGSKSLDASAGIAQSPKGVENPSRAKGPENGLGISPGFQYTNDVERHDDDDERRRTKILRKLMHKN